VARRAARNYVRRRRVQEEAGNNNEDAGGVAMGHNIGNRKEDLADNESSNPIVMTGLYVQTRPLQMGAR
jgi:hypothetical protein